MAKKTKYRATFPNGEVLTRSSSRTYTHAWIVGGSYADSDRRWGQGGFSSSAELARRAAASFSGNAYSPLEYSEVVPVEVV